MITHNRYLKRRDKTRQVHEWFEKHKEYHGFVQTWYQNN